MWKTKGILAVALLLLTACIPASKAQSIEETVLAPEEGLWVDMSLGPDLVDWFNQNARPGDMARADHVSMVDLLDTVNVGRKLLVFKSVSDAEQLLPRLADKIDVIGYNLEHGPSNRPDEQGDPVGSVQRMRALADQYDKELFLGPDHTFALDDGVAMAPYVDMFVLQVQRAQTEPEVVREFVLPMVAQLRQANPDLEISVQVRTEGDVVAISDLIASLEPHLDGVSILTSQETVDVAKALMVELRPAQPEPPDPLPSPTPTSTALQAGVLPTSTTSMRRTVAATPAPTTVEPEPTSTSSGGLRSWLMWASLLTMGFILSGLVATAVIYSYQSLRSR